MSDQLPAYFKMNEQEQRAKTYRRGVIEVIDPQVTQPNNVNTHRLVKIDTDTMYDYGDMI